MEIYEKNVKWANLPIGTSIGLSKPSTLRRVKTEIDKFISILQNARNCQIFEIKITDMGLSIILLARATPQSLQEHLVGYLTPIPRAIQHHFQHHQSIMRDSDNKNCVFFGPCSLLNHRCYQKGIFETEFTSYNSFITVKNAVIVAGAQLHVAYHRHEGMIAGDIKCTNLLCNHNNHYANDIRASKVKAAEKIKYMK